MQEKMFVVAAAIIMVISFTIGEGAARAYDFSENKRGNIMQNRTFLPAKIMLPRTGTDLTKWAVVACDQYTSLPEYWHEVEEKVGDAPSTLHIVFPEVYLKEGTKRIDSINSTMESYVKDGIVAESVNGFILVERDTPSGKRLGLIGLIDLEQYDYTPGADAMIRATEGTVPERIPPRIKIRENALLELPHVMILIDDREARVIENLFNEKEKLRALYDFDLMMNGGHLRGYAVEGETAEKVLEEFDELAKKSGGFLFAVGDGNHSLATAKACWEKTKARLNEEERETHPARFAMTEVVNLHCEALQFEPIHRLLLNADMETLADGFEEYLKKQNITPGEGDDVIFTGSGKKCAFSVSDPSGRLPVDLLQSYLDKYLSENKESSIDYIHGESDLVSLAEKSGGCGILLKAIDKNSLFPAIKAGGVLPRKTFSMGEAYEKRYYMECRKIK